MRALVLIVLVAALTADTYGQAQKPSSAFRIGRAK